VYCVQCKNGEYEKKCIRSDVEKEALKEIRKWTTNWSFFFKAAVISAWITNDFRKKERGDERD